MLRIGSQVKLALTEQNCPTRNSRLSGVIKDYTWDKGLYYFIVKWEDGSLLGGYKKEDLVFADLEERVQSLHCDVQVLTEAHNMLVGKVNKTTGDHMKVLNFNKRLFQSTELYTLYGRKTIVPKVVYIDMDDTLVQFTKLYSELKIESPELLYPHSLKGFFRNLEPVENAQNAWRMLITSEGYKPYILTAPSIKNIHSFSEKAESVKRLFGETALDRLIVSGHKHLLKGDILIDDQATGKGQDMFDGDFIHFGSKEYPDWLNVMQRLM